MNNILIEDVIKRIEIMESYFDLLSVAYKENKNDIFIKEDLKEYLEILINYYESKAWLNDYELDEAGLLPEKLKRGVLSQDALYNFLNELKD